VSGRVSSARVADAGEPDEPAVTHDPALITRAIDELASGRDLSAEQTADVLAQIMAGEATQIQIAGFLIALRTKGETVDELTGLATTMRRLAAPVAVAHRDLLDTAGTGGGRRTFNVSTTAALIAAGAGCTVAKHGNRSATGLSGSADLLEALGARIDLTPAAVARCIDEAGFGFMFAPAHHQATRYVIPVRGELRVRTIFNFLGPLTNPAGAERQLIGVSDAAYVETMAGALQRLGTRHALLVSSSDGLDELSVSAPTHVFEVTPDAITSYDVAPEEVGLQRAAPEAVPGGDPAQNAEITRRILAGEGTGAGAGATDRAARDLALLNAGAAIYAGGGAGSLGDGVAAATRAVDGGAAAEATRRFVDATHRLAP
jgi:anthranilate phosphoribosyltransferase